MTDFGYLLHVGANHARSGEVLLGARGDVGEHGLDLFKAFVNLPAEVLDDDARHGQGQEGVEGEFGADFHHVDQRADGEDQRVGGIHDGGAEQHAHRIQVVGGARHDVAGAGALIVGIGEALEVLEQVVAQIEFDVARDTNHDPARQELEDSLTERDGNHQQGVENQLLGRASAFLEIVQGHADDLRRLHGDAIQKQHAQGTHHETAAVFLQVGIERAQAFRQHR